MGHDTSTDPDAPVTRAERAAALRSTAALASGFAIGQVLPYPRAVLVAALVVVGLFGLYAWWAGTTGSGRARRARRRVVQRAVPWWHHAVAVAAGLVAALPVVLLLGDQSLGEALTLGAAGGVGITIAAAFGGRGGAAGDVSTAREPAATDLVRGMDTAEAWRRSYGCQAVTSAGPASSWR